MGIASYLQQLWKKPKDHPLWKTRLMAYRRDPATLKVERPTRLDRARALGYTSKKGVFVVRQRVKRGGHTRQRTKGKRSKRQSIKLILQKNYQHIAEERANKKFTNAEVLGSYWVAKDGKHVWYEVLLVDRDHPQVKADKSLSWVKAQRGRVYRGKTSAGRKSRALHRKGKGVEKARPSRRANKRTL
ncbi:50S ribosomal protein L15e [Candidatus Woesearchaeota archaeon]|nr:50S ribosomal protein L15e [Candidatus Woesearchaeota archaeon]